jgi:hypothetical protein
MSQQHVGLIIVGNKVVAVKPAGPSPRSDSHGSDERSSAPSIQPDHPSDHNADAHS